jgi:hypothetical protein
MSAFVALHGEHRVQLRLMLLLSVVAAGPRPGYNADGSCMPGHGPSVGGGDGVCNTCLVGFSGE